MKFCIKAGRFNFDKETKKVKVQKQKGLITVFRNEECQTHFSWVNTETKIQQIDLIVFPYDAIFQQLDTKPNTFILKFQTDEDKYFFWFQEKTDPKHVLSEINKIINYQPEEQGQMVAEEHPKSETKPSNDVKVPQSSIVNPQPDFIKRMQANLIAAQQKQEKSLTHLNKVIGIQAVNAILNQSTQTQQNQLADFLPQEQKDKKYLSSNIRSPQFLQALESLSDALNSENAISLFMELGLNQKYLHQHYGVHAFLKALEEWGIANSQKKQEKQEMEIEKNKDDSEQIKPENEKSDKKEPMDEEK